MCCNGVRTGEDIATAAGWLASFETGVSAASAGLVRGETLAGSDIDILADVEPSIGLDFVTLADKLEELTGHKIDLVSRRAIKPLLWKQIEPELIDV